MSDLEMLFFFVGWFLLAVVVVMGEAFDPLITRRWRK